jgi:protein-L-isoaspartate(D-aspartate) O-methyltransferase
MTAALRRAYANAVAAGGPPALVEAFATVPRERFLGPGPWQVVQLRAEFPYATTPDDALAHVYRDSVIGLIPAKQLNNGMPSAHARWIAAARPAPGESVLHVGCGTGYYTAILAELVGSHGRVVGVDVEPELVARASAALAAWPQATAVVGDASDPHGDHDVIYINAGVTHPRQEWLDALRPGGRLVVPMTMRVAPLPHGAGVYLAIEARGVRWPVTIISQVVIYDCVGARDPAVEAQLHALLAAAARGTGLAATREPHAHADTCLVHVAGFCIYLSDT